MLLHLLFETFPIHRFIFLLRDCSLPKVSQIILFYPLFIIRFSIFLIVQYLYLSISMTLKFFPSTFIDPSNSILYKPYKTCVLSHNSLDLLLYEGICYMSTSISVNPYLSFEFEYQNLLSFIFLQW